MTIPRQSTAEPTEMKPPRKQCTAGFDPAQRDITEPESTALTPRPRYLKTRHSGEQTGRAGNAQTMAA